MDKLKILILAAGESTRMKSETTKLLFPLCGRAIIEWILQTLHPLMPEEIILVVGHQSQNIVRFLKQRAENSRNTIESHATLRFVQQVNLRWSRRVQHPQHPVEKHVPLRFVLQKKQSGTGNAVQVASRYLQNFRGNLLVVCGDTPLITTNTLKRFLSKHIKSGNDLTLLTAHLKNPYGYGRIVRGRNDALTHICEEANLSDDQKSIIEINTGFYLCRSSNFFWKTVAGLKRNLVKDEYYFTDVVERFSAADKKICAVKTDNPDEILGINTRQDLASAENTMRQRINEKHMLAGITIIDPGNTYIDESVRIGRDTIISPCVTLRGKTKIGKNCFIGQGSFIENSVIEDSVHIRCSFIYGSIIKKGTKVGPFAHIRPGSVVGKSARVGNFVEVKKSSIGKNTKVSHLAYIGDCSLEENINVGAGAITCNFDGFKKHKTHIGKNTFVGSNVNLVAPVKVGRDSIIGAGSTITKDIPPNSLAIARERQTVKPLRFLKKVILQKKHTENSK